ncbi:type IV secretory system conjugative DNA transfer family protein [Planomonospora sp. ID82291]|uniref:type IV secretory system conjugative DNA transfer family protein n=1 Tax=Planomonospora sp. ID82291 TaxID=2738136 RepID=UPI0018C423BE|nr:TraM recognition domain-containing protein [Planomonospora sp. ID82291]MBG0819117.1 TraM recognition domain-containing protein [Planomonospora sp. ID82291]
MSITSPADTAPPLQIDPWANFNLPVPLPLLIAGLLALCVAIVVAQIIYRAIVPPAGFATPWDIRQHLSARAARGRMDRTRPSLLGQRVPVSEYAYRVGRSLSPYMTICCNPEDSAVLVGPPGAGKSALLADIVADAPGAVIYTSSKIADYDTTARIRSQFGPVALFNPLGLGGMQSTVRYNPVRGCEDPDLAMRRGAALLFALRRPGDSSNMSDYFHSQANEVLRSLLHAAALGGLTLVDVQRWANDPTSVEALRILERYDADPRWIELLRARQEITTTTRDGIFSTLATALSWLSGPAAAYCVTPPPGEDFDMEDFILRRGTLYMVGEDSGEGDGVAPLFTLIMTDLEEVCIRLAGQMPNRRMDPWVTWALDEVATICPVPLDKWISKWRQHSMLILAGIQSKSQLYDRWGRNGGDTIWGVAALTLAFGGIKNADDLRELSILCGEREEIQTSTQHGPNGPTRSEHTVLRPIMPPHKIRQLKRWRALVIYRSAPPTIVKIRKVWKRRDLSKRVVPPLAVPAPAPRRRTVPADTLWIEER